MKILKFIFLISLFLVVYFIIYKLYAKKEADKFKLGKIQRRVKNIKVDKFFKKFLPDIDNIYTYLITKITFLYIFSYLGFTNYNSFFMALIFGVAGFSLPDLMVKIIKNTEKKEVYIDLLNVVECLKVQLSSNIPLLIALKNTPDLCKNKKLRNSLYDMYLEYELSGYSLGGSISKIKKKFKLLEINMFLSAIEQHIKYGQATENYDNLIVILKEKYIEYIENGTQSKMMIMTVGILIILINLAVMGCYPIIVEINNNLSTMLG